VEILGISGSPVSNSNLDRLIQTTLEATGLKTTFIKLSRLTLTPCRACLKCVPANRCIQKDDWEKIAEKMLQAQAIVIGAYTTFNTLDGWTKILFERMFAFRHQKKILHGKIGVAVGMGYKCAELGYEGPPSAEVVANYIESVLKGFGVNVIGKVIGRGNPPCLSCGAGEICDYSNVIRIWGKGARITPDKFNRIENQKESLAQARGLGKQIKEMLADHKK
jgi:multimeric flavodoxin WrbA